MKERNESVKFDLANCSIIIYCFTYTIGIHRYCYLVIFEDKYFLSNVVLYFR